MIWLVLGAIGLFLAGGAALAYIFGATAVLAFIASGNAHFLRILPQRIFSNIDSFALMAMALFLMVGEVMNRMGITESLVRFSMSLVGRFKGGLGHVDIITSVFFAGVSGSAVADAAALSITLVPAMRKQGYDVAYASALTAAAAVIGPIIPPSIPLIFYGSQMQVSVGALFLGGVIPGLIMAAFLLATNLVYAHRYDHPGGKGEQRPQFLSSFYHGAPSLMLPLIIMGGIVFGIVTPTEAGGLAVAAAIGAGLIYGRVNLSDLFNSLERTAILTGSIFVILAAAACIQWIGSLEQWPQQIARLATESGLTGLKFLLLVNLFFIIAGMFMDTFMCLALLVPLFGPACVSQGIDPIHLGVILCVNLSIGQITPPLGGCLVVTSAVTGVNYWTLARALIPFMIVEILVLLLVTFLPEISLFLPRMLGFL